jgi:chromosome segregation ATPase
MQRENAMLRKKHEAEMIKVHHETWQLMTSLQETQDCRDNAEADLADLREKFDQKRLEADELRLQSNVFQEQLTQALMRAEDEHDRRAGLEKAHSDLQSELANLSIVFYYYLILNYQI